MLHQGCVDEAELVIDVDIALQPCTRVLELHWEEWVRLGKRENEMRLAYRDVCAWYRQNVLEAGPL